MTDTIRWCFKHNAPNATLWASGDDQSCVSMKGNCNVADALVIRADQPVYRIDERLFFKVTGHHADDPGEPQEEWLIRIGAET